MIRAVSTDERGMALAAAIFALVIVGALVAANFFAGLLEQQSGQNSLFARQAAEGAEAALQEALADVLPSALVSLPVGGAPLDLGAGAVGPGVRVERQITRLTRALFLVRVRSTRHNAAGGALAVRALGSLVRLIPNPAGGSPAVMPFGQRGWVQLY